MGVRGGILAGASLAVTHCRSLDWLLAPCAMCNVVSGIVLAGSFTICCFPCRRAGAGQDCAGACAQFVCCVLQLRAVHSQPPEDFLASRSSQV
jgi:hypothetical protein